MQKINGTIGEDINSTWQVPNMTKRKDEVNAIDIFRKSMKNESAETNHRKQLLFMADNGFCQHGYPRIEIFADRIRPEPLHLEINNWQHVLDLLYKESVCRGCFKEFIEMLRNSEK